MKIQVKCANCNKDLLRWEGNKNYYCDKKCKAEHQKIYRNGYRHSEETKHKIAIGNSKPLSEERKKHISITRRKLNDIPIESYPEMIELLRKPYYSFKLISKHTGFKMNRIREFANNSTNADILNANAIRFKGYFNNNKFLSDKSKLDWFAENVDKLSRKEMRGLFGSSPNGVWVKKYFNKLYKPTKYEFHKGKTLPEIKIEEFLIANNIVYEYNYPIRVFDLNNNPAEYSIDFYIFINNCHIFIEVQGDFWHGNPLIFNDYNKLHGSQKSNINRDKRKKAQIYSAYKNLKYYEVWEYDINNNTEQLIKFKNDILCIVQS